MNNTELKRAQSHKRVSFSEQKDTVRFFPEEAVRIEDDWEWSISFLLTKIKLLISFSGSKLHDHFAELVVAGVIIHHSDGEWAAGTLCDSLSLANLFEGDAELIAAGAGVVESLVIWFEVQVLDLNFVVDLGRHPSTI